MLGKLSVVALTATTLMVLAPAYAQRGGGEGGGAGGSARRGRAHQRAEMGHQLQPQPRVAVGLAHQLEPRLPAAGAVALRLPGEAVVVHPPLAALHLVAMAAMRTETPMTEGSISKSGGPLSGGAIRRNLVRREASLLARTMVRIRRRTVLARIPIGFVWVCGG